MLPVRLALSVAAWLGMAGTLAGQAKTAPDAHPAPLTQGYSSLSATPPQALASLRPQHVALSVSDLEESVRWYQEKLGFTRVIRRAFPAIATRAANLELNGFQIELFQRDHSQQPFQPPANVPDDLLGQGYKHIGFIVDDLDAAIAELNRRGVPLVDQPTRVEALGLRLCFIRDNNGYLIELGER